MMLGVRELFVVTLSIVTIGVLFRYRESQNVAGGVPIDPSQEIVVWNSLRPVGQTWASLGNDGKIELPADSGMDGSGTALTLRMTGQGFRGCGLNWKGWYPAEACDDVTSFNSLVFYIRQATEVPMLDLRVNLLDNLKRPSGESASNGVYVVGDGGLKKIDKEWRKVVLPLEKFTQNRPLRLERLWQVDFTNENDGLAIIQIDRIGFSKERPSLPTFPERPGYKANGQIDVAARGHPISDRIYGVCTLPVDQLRTMSIPITRWGGNTSSRYNWKNNFDNGGADWYFKNRGQPIKDLSQTGYLQSIKSAQTRGATMYLTIPMLGWVSKDAESYGFSVKRYGPQKATEPGHTDVGNGMGLDGTPIRGNDPCDTSIAVGPDFVAAATSFLVKSAGSANERGVQYYVLDNEPMIWHETHRDVRPNPLGYDELWDRTVAYAEAIRRADPSARIAGFCSWGWTDLFFSAKDRGTDNYATQADSKAHGCLPLAEWFIRKCGEYKKTTGKTLIDVLDFHWYPQSQVLGKTPYGGRGMGLELNDLRLRSTRDLWDPTYSQESWIRNTGDHKPTEVIRRIRRWIELHNPGMEICLGEYNFGGGDNISGGLAQADVFGILARERVDLAFIWNTPEGTQNLAWQLYRDYDGKGGRFGEIHLPTSSTHPDVAVHAAKRTDGSTTIVLVNKNLGGPCDFTLEAPGLKGELKAWRFDSATNRVCDVAAEPKTINGNVTMKLPAASATMLIVK